MCVKFGTYFKRFFSGLPGVFKSHGQNQDFFMAIWHLKYGHIFQPSRNFSYYIENQPKTKGFQSQNGKFSLRFLRFFFRLEMEEKATFLSKFGHNMATNSNMATI